MMDSFNWLFTYPYHWLLPLAAGYVLCGLGLIARVLELRQRALARASSVSVG